MVETGCRDFFSHKIKKPISRLKSYASVASYVSEMAELILMYNSNAINRYRVSSKLKYSINVEVL